MGRSKSSPSSSPSLSLSIIWSITVLVVVMQGVEGSEWNIRYHLNTATMYWTQQDALTYTPAPEQCSPVQLNHLSRHGARFPSSSDLSKFSALSSVMQQFSSYYLPPYQWMASWSNPYRTEDAGLLTYLGQVELYNAAQRMSKELSPLLSDKYKPYTYPFQSTYVSRTGQSGQSFGYSLQQSNGHLPPYSGSYQPFFISSNSPPLDFQLRFFDNCPLYQSQVKENSTAGVQADIFGEEYVTPLGIELSKQIGVYPHWNISSSQVGSMYKLCSFDLSIHNVTDKFCALFDQEKGEIMEYYNDLKDYYEKGYGYPINYQIACPLLRDFFDLSDSFISSSSSSSSSPPAKAKFRFAHAETHLPFISLLGLYKDETPLMANWSWDQINSRKWRSSLISPFGANFQSILYHCPQSPSGYMLRVLVNEREMVLPMCSSVYCDYEKVMSYYEDALQCPFSDLCFPPHTSPCSFSYHHSLLED